MALEFETCDVFTTTRFGGNPLAVVYDAAALDGAAMQTIAREFNLSETVFVLAADAAAATANIRIFTPRIELPFAGHPNVGAAVMLARRLGLAGDALALDQAAGRVMARLARDSAGTVTAASIEAPGPFVMGDAVPVATVAACVGVAQGIIIGQPVIGSCGAPFLLAELADTTALAAASPDAAAFRARLPVETAIGIHLFTRLGERRLRTRMFAPLGGIAEDPATGGANVALAGLLLDRAGGDQLAVEVEQGVEMGRPSLLSVAARRDGGAIRVAVGGGVVPVTRGRITP